jgi:hypothetical protein
MIIIKKEGFSGSAGAAGYLRGLLSTLERPFVWARSEGFGKPS